MTFDVLIIGAGIVGAACAWECSRAGLSTAVVECDTIGSGATAAGMGHIVVMDEGEAQLRLTRYSQQLWDELAQDDPIPHEYHRCGTLWVAANTEELQEACQKQRVFEQHGIASEVIDAQQLGEMEPHLRPGLAGGLLVPGDSVVYPPRSAALLMERAQQKGAQLIYGKVSQLLPGAVQISNGQNIQAGIIILANGAQAPRLAPELPIRYKKGHLLITDRYPGFVRHQLVELGYIKNVHVSSGDTISFNVQPRSTGQLLIGSSRQFDIETSEIDHKMLGRMLMLAQEYLPELAQISCLRAWTGFRAATADGLPLIGPHPWRKGLWLATGHEGLGITTSLATARLLLAQVLEQPTPIPYEPYLPARALREEKEHV
jgi:glycine/D-amino acid oxidase-like deaminating enzyme